MFLLALCLRGGLAVLTEFAPIFPAYYYTDAQLMDEAASSVAQAWRDGEPISLPGSPTQRVHAVLLAALYLIFGHHMLAGKLFFALCGALAAGLFARLLEPAFGRRTALASALLLALWPSHIFFTSQNFKDALVILLGYLALDGALPLLGGRSRGPLKASQILAALFCIGFFRGYMMVTLTVIIAASLLAGLLLAAQRGGAKGPPSWGLAGALLAPLLFLPLANALFSGPLHVPNAAHDPATHLKVMPASYDNKTGGFIKPYTPEGLSELRRLRQESDLHWARTHRNREIGTQLFYGLRLETWLDVLLFLPKGMFYVLFMPLPLFYPLGANLGRLLASLENVLLLGFTLAGLRGVIKGPKTAERGLLAVLFLVMAMGSALLEFDLGSATRHRTFYLPLLFPFALWGAWPARRARREGKLRVLQVLECGGPGGTGHQVAALCNRLDPARFDVGLVYASRDGRPETYRGSAPGARRAFHVPELVREISPRRDLRAFLALYRLFQDEAPDVVHLHSSKAGFLGRLAAWLSGTPKIFYSPRGYSFLQQDRGPAARGLYRLLECSVSWIGEIVAVSPSEAALARELSWDRPVHAVPDPFLPFPSEAALPRVIARSPAPGAVLGGCGRLTAARNPEAFLNLCQRLTDSRNNVRCVWIGGGEDEAKVRKHLENMNLAGKVEVTGWLESAGARERMKGLDVFVHFSRWDALPNAVLEAMALGLPVVASDIPGCRDCVRHGETGFLAKSEVELLELCLKLIDDPGLRRRLGSAGRDRVLKDFSLESALSCLEALYAASEAQPLGPSEGI